ncbi:glycosyltransferase family 2 protein, partial [Kocuria oceani]
MSFFSTMTQPRSDYIETAISALDSNPEAVGVTGSLILDGASRGYPVSFGEARSALKSSWREHASLQVVDVPSLYGCNFAVRYSAAASLLFDDQLPLYSWLEDLDYSRRLAHRGRLVRCDQCVAVHHGSASGGRTQHVRFGYSQITNPVHLWKKGSISPVHTGILIFKPFTGSSVIEWGSGDEPAGRQE